MKQTYNPNKIIVHAGWLGDEFFIWGEQKQHKRYKEYHNFQYPFLYSPFELKLAIFRNDPTSFYGTFIETKKANLLTPIRDRIFYSYIDKVHIYQARPNDDTFVFPIEGLILPIHELPKFLPTLHSLKNRPNFYLAHDFLFWLNVFQVIVEKITAGEFIPTTKRTWELTNTNWYEWVQAMPQSSVSLDDNRPKQFMTEGEKLTILLKKANQFCHYFIQQFIQEDRDVSEAFQLLLDNDIAQDLFTEENHSLKQVVLLKIHLYFIEVFV